MGVVKPLAALFGLLALAGCGGSAAAVPKEDPGVALTRLVHFELTGKLDRSYAMLVREQRAVVDRNLYLSCRPGLPMDAKVAVLGVADEDYAVPALGKTRTKVVRYKMTLRPAGGPPVTISDKAHLVAQDGNWRWTLSAKSFGRYKSGICP
jgi:hypothetical protein